MPQSNGYPTKEEILTPEMVFAPELVTIMLKWKNVFWKNSKEDDAAKRAALGDLIHLLNAYYGKETQLVFMSLGRTVNSSDYYNITTDTIHMKDASIISFLHEYGHANTGRSELAACRYSVQLFKLIFPIAYEKLIWDGHMLRKPL